MSLEEKKRIPKSSIILGIIYGLISAGFYTTPIMFFLLGLASISIVAAFQRVLLNFAWLFILLGILLALTTIMIYLRRRNVQKLTLAEIRPHWAFIGGMVITMIITYAILVTIALIKLGISNDLF